MILKSLRLLLLCVLPCSFVVASETAILIMSGTTKTSDAGLVVSGKPSAIIRKDGGQTRIDADHIIYESTAHVLRAKGNVRMTSLSSSNDAFVVQEMTLEFSTATPTVYVLNRDGITISSGVPAPLPPSPATFEAMTFESTDGPALKINFTRTPAPALKPAVYSPRGTDLIATPEDQKIISDALRLKLQTSEPAKAPR